MRVWTSLLAIVDGPLGPTGQDPDAPRDLACDLTVSQRVCSPTEPEPPDPPDIDLPDPGVAAAGGSVVASILVVVLVAALVAAIAWLVVVLIRQRRPQEEDEEEEIDVDIDEDLGIGDSQQRIIDDERPPQRWRGLARQHREAGEFRDAVRCEYRALVGDLARAGIVDEIPGRTSGEERAQLRVIAPSVALAFDEAADIFDQSWFDDPPTTVEVDERFQQMARAVLDDVLNTASSVRR